jgi:uncharacterized membrane protein YgcG
MRARWICSFLLMFALAFPALAQERRGANSLDRVLPHIRQTVPGTFYDAEGPFPGPNGRLAYRLKWMTPDGRIIWFSVDAQSGQVIGGMPGGPPPGRYRDNSAGQGSWGSAPRNNFGPGNGYPGGPWNNGQGNGQGNGSWGQGNNQGNDDNRGSSWHDRRGNNNGGNDGRDNNGRGNGWGHGGNNNGGNNGGGDNRGGRHRPGGG